MKHTFSIFCAALCCCTSLHAQYTNVPAPPSYSVANLSGATLPQILDTMYAHANVNDTGEGGEMEQIKEFRLFWEGRVAVNDSSGINMFQRYYSALGRAIGSRLSGGGCTGGWVQAGHMPQ